jgi:hypothetical protein
MQQVQEHSGKEADEQVADRLRPRREGSQRWSVNPSV